MADEANPYGMKRPRTGLPSTTKTAGLPSTTKTAGLPSTTKTREGLPSTTKTAVPPSQTKSSDITIDSRVNSGGSGVDVSKNRTLAMRKAYVNSEIRKHKTMPSIYGRNFRTRKHGEVDS